MKKPLSILKLAVLLLGLVGFAHAGPLDGKSPAYFVDRYGPAKSSRIEPRREFFQPKYGSMGIKGPFSVRVFQKGDMRIEAVFFYPSLRLAAVRLQMNQRWTQEQIDAALQAYGGEWKDDRSSIGITSWRAPDGTLAISMLTWMDFHAKEVRDAVDRATEEYEAKKKAVPQF